MPARLLVDARQMWKLQLLQLLAQCRQLATALHVQQSSMQCLSGVQVQSPSLESSYTHAWPQPLLAFGRFFRPALACKAECPPPLCLHLAWPGLAAHVPAPCLPAQAPWHLLWGPSWDYSCAQAASPAGGAGSDPQGSFACTLPRLLGICRLADYHFPAPPPPPPPPPHTRAAPGPGPALGRLLRSMVMAAGSKLVHASAAPAARGRVLVRDGSPLGDLLASPLLCDVIIWALLRLHARIVASPLFAQVRSDSAPHAPMLQCPDKAGLRVG